MRTMAKEKLQLKGKNTIKMDCTKFSKKKQNKPLIPALRRQDRLISVSSNVVYTEKVPGQTEFKMRPCLSPNPQKGKKIGDCPNI